MAGGCGGRGDGDRADAGNIERRRIHLHLRGLDLVRVRRSARVPARKGRRALVACFARARSRAREGGVRVPVRSRKSAAKGSLSSLRLCRGTRAPDNVLDYRACPSTGGCASEAIQECNVGTAPPLPSEFRHWPEPVVLVPCGALRCAQGFLSL